MREARDFWMTFDPQTVEEYSAVMFGPSGAAVRQVLSYWDMAASLVENNAIDRQMFYDATMEFLVVYTKMEPILGKLRESFGNPGFLKNLEKLVMGLPDAQTQIETMKARMKWMREARAAAQAAG